MSEWIRDVEDSSFDEVVLRGSSERPVVVDFWAEWCGPCRTLGPVLESLAKEFRGEFLLAKVNTESAPEISGKYQIRSIPAVMAFRDGQVVSEFVGAQPEAAVRSFLDALIPSEADRITDEAETLVISNSLPEAELKYNDALELEAGHPRASRGFANLLIDRQAFDKASEIIGAARLGTPEDSEIERIETTIRVRSVGPQSLEQLERDAEAEPDDIAAQIDWGRGLASADRSRQALERFLLALKLDPEFEDQAARKAMLEVFEVLGSDHDLTREFRGKLARAIYR
jgi:putative thioredoxin